MAAQKQTIRSNHVRFVSSAGTLHLKLDGPWKRTAGLAPDVNFAFVDARELTDSFKGDAIEGQVLFSYTDANTTDVTLNAIRIASIEHSRLATDPDTGDAKVVEWHVAFVDSRRKYVWPRGGVLNAGEINTEPLTNGGGQDADGNDLLNPQRLANLCLSAMGAGPIAPNGMSDYRAPHNIQWRAAHAPTELATLLKATNHRAFCNKAGNLNIVTIGLGDPPEIAGPRKIMSAAVPSIDLRAEVVVVTSAPRAATVTRTITGIAAAGGGDEADNDPKWEWVIPDGDGKWKTYDESGYFDQDEPENAVRNHFKNVPEVKRDWVSKFIYRCFRIVPGSLGSARIERQVVEVDPQSGDGSLVYNEIQVMAKVATMDQAGIWSNADDYVKLPGGGVVDTGDVIMMTERLARLPDDFKTTDIYSNFKALTDDDLKVRVSYEDYEQQDDGTWRPVFFQRGFARTNTGTGVEKLGDADTQAALANPDTIVVRAPELHQLFTEDGDLNGAKLDALAGAYTPAYLAPVAGSSQILIASGYFDCELSGRVESVEYDQDKLTTTIRVDTWWTAYAETVGQIPKDGRQSGGGGSEKYPLHADQISDRTARGASGAVQPSVPLFPPLAAQPPQNFVKVKITDYGEGGGKYVGVFVDGESTASDDDNSQSGGWLNEPEGMKDSTNKASILNLYEDRPFTDHGDPPVKYAQMLPKGSYHLGRLVHQGTNGATVEIESCLCGATDGETIGMLDASTASPDDTHDTNNVDRRLVNFVMCSRVAYASGGTAVIGMFRTLRFECGVLRSIGGEVPRTVIPVAPCT